MDRSPFSMLSLNVRGIRENIKRKNIFEWCKSKGSDITFLQETYSTIEVEKKWESEWNGPIIFSHGSNHSRGVLILLSPNLNLKVDNVVTDKNGRYIVIKVELQETKLVLCNCYFPTRDKEKMQLEFLEELHNCISKFQNTGQLFLLGGDFNTIMDGDLDYMGPKNVSKNKFNENFEDFLDRFSLVDIWRKRNPNNKQFTFRQKWPIIQSRLDYWFGSSSLQNVVQNCKILTSITPDHSAVLLQLRNFLETPNYGKSYWKFNNSLCADQEFVNSFKDKIMELKEEWIPVIADKLVLWDFLKMKMREYIINYTKKKAKLRKNEIDKLEEEIKYLENQLLNVGSRNVVVEIEQKKSRLNKLYDFSRQGLKIRSRAEYFEEGEQKTQYFEQLVKSNKRKSVIKELYNQDEEIITDRKEILKIIKSYYEKLYSNDEVTSDLNDLFLNDIPKLSEENQKLCEGKVTRNECFSVLKEMKFNKSPGNDGFTVEFYYTFWSVLGETLVEILNEAYDRGNLSTSQKQGVITLLEKEGKNKMYVQNYRPITLLNVDYKILSKVLAKRLKEVLGEIIHHDQVGYIKDRNIGEAVRLIDDMLFHSIDQNIGFLVTVDFEKAFDSVSHDFLFKALESFGFGHTFRSWVKVLYTDISSCIMNGGYSTGYFNLKRGVRQGDPLSPYLFLLAIETLALVIRKDTAVKGVQFENSEIKQILYADDISLFVKDTNSINRLQYLFEEFRKVSGLKINKGKTNFLWMGKDNDRPQIPLFGNLVQQVKILGIHFSVDIRIKEDLNYKEILSKIKRLLGWWKERDLTLMGKIHLLKTYALSRLNYVSSLIVVPQWLFNEVEKITFEFLWAGKDRIKRKIMYQDYSYGGLRMMNFRLFVKTQRIMWLKRLLYGEKNIGWKLYFDYCFRTVGGRFLFLCNYHTPKLNLKIPPFYIEMLKAWQDMEKFRYSANEVNPVIFNNSNICMKGKMIFDKDLFDKGIYHVNHIFDNGHVKPVAHFQNIGLNANQLLKIIEIAHVIPTTWKNASPSVKFQQVDLLDFDINLNVSGQIKLFQATKSSNIYDCFVKDLRETYDLQIKDCNSKFDLTDKEISNLFTAARNTTLIRKQKEFQFMLLHGVIYTKVQLMKFGFVEDDFCSFCKKDRETYSHLFFNCGKVKDLWHFTKEHFNLFELRNMEWCDIFLGLSGNSNRIKCVNSIITWVKYTIFKSRADGHLPSNFKIEKIITDFIEEEKGLATKTGRLSVHLQKWEELKVNVNVNG